MQLAHYHLSGIARILEGCACCALCAEAIRPDEDALVTPDFLADETDPFWYFADATMHQACFLVWDRRKIFVAHHNRLAQRWPGPHGSYPFMTSEGQIVSRLSSSACEPPLGAELLNHPGQHPHLGGIHRTLRIGLQPRDQLI
jgi:hypothetical protein